MFQVTILCAVFIQVQALELLGVFLQVSRDEQAVAKILRRVNDIVAYDFPISSSDFVQQSAVFTEYIASIDRLLSILVSSKSPGLLETLFPLLRESEHPHRAAILGKLGEFVAALGDEEVPRVFAVSFNALMDESLGTHLLWVLVTLVDHDSVITSPNDLAPCLRDTLLPLQRFHCPLPFC